MGDDTTLDITHTPHRPKTSLPGAVSAGMGLYEDKYEADDRHPTSESPGPADAGKTPSPVIPVFHNVSVLRGQLEKGV